MAALSSGTSSSTSPVRSSILKRPHTNGTAQVLAFAIHDESSSSGQQMSRKASRSYCGNNPTTFITVAPSSFILSFASRTQHHPLSLTPYLWLRIQSLPNRRPPPASNLVLSEHHTLYHIFSGSLAGGVYRHEPIKSSQREQMDSVCIRETVMQAA